MPREDGTQTAAQPLSSAELDLINAWWRAANYLSVGQIYLLDNPLLERPLERADIKPRLLGHWGTTPGLNFVYVHLNRVIKARGLDMIYICGPGHGGSRNGREYLARGHLQRDLPEHPAEQGWNAAAVQAIQLSGRDPEPRRARDAGVHPRRG